MLPELPVPQKPLELLAGGTAGGIAVGVGLAFLLSAMDRSLKTVDQAEAFLGLPVLAAVPELSRKNKKRKKEKEVQPEAFADLPILVDGNSPPAEAIRSLRAAMSLLGADEERKTVIFTSALPGEGKSFTASNYALSLAGRGQRTLLVDADLRRPRLHAIFHADRQNTGLVDFLLHRDPLAHFVHSTSLPDLDLLLSGTKAPNPAELLSGRGFSRLIAESMKCYDQVVIDTAPIHAVSDTLMLVPEIQSVVLVVQAAASPREAVLRAVRVLDGAGKRPVGLVLNRLPRRADLGYHRTYYYHYGASDQYGEAYGEKAG